MAKKESYTNALNSELNNEADNAVRPVSPDEVYANKGVIMDVARRLYWDYDSGKDLVQEVALKCWRADFLHVF